MASDVSDIRLGSAYEYIATTGRLPSPTGVVLEIIRLADDDETTAVTLAPVVQSDPAIAARLLKLANAPVSGGSRQVASVEKAVALLGLRTTKIVSLGFSLVSTHRVGSCSSFSYDQFWLESVARAATARNLCTRLRGVSPDEGFTLGLLSQIGRLALATVFPQRYSELLETVDTDDPDVLSAAESSFFEIRATELTAAMVAGWGLPSIFCTALQAQDDPDSGGLTPESATHKLAWILHLATPMARVLVRRAGTPQEFEFLAMAAGKLGIGADDFESLFDQVAVELQESGRIFDIAVRRVPPLSKLVDRSLELRRAVATPNEPKTRDREPATTQPLSDSELEILESLASDLPRLQRLLDELSARKKHLLRRHEEELESLQRRHADDISPVDVEYAQAYDLFLNSRQAAIRLEKAANVVEG